VPREVVALVSADDVVAAVRVHADRVHDLLRRSGCAAEEAIEVCESYAVALVDAIVNAPETVGDMAGWWFGKALELSRRIGETAAESPHEAPTSVLAGTEGEAQVRAALASLPESERAAVMLRDAYDLPPEAVAVALRRDVASAALLVAVGRLHLVERYDGRPVPELSGHTGRTPADLAVLGRLVDGSLPPPRTMPLRRHLSDCQACEEVAEALAKGRRLAAGLPVIAMPDDARETMLERVADRANAVLPSVDEVLLAVDEDDNAGGPTLSPVAVVLALVLALVLGVAVAAITRPGTGGQSAAAGPPTPAPSVQPSFSVSATATSSASPTASARPTSSATASSRPTASPTASASSAAPAPAAVFVSPASGPRGTTITVTGTGWTPGADIAVTYSGAISSSKTTTVADSRGGFRIELTANGLVPGAYTVRAQGGGSSASASFTQTS
jgi:DNA-directed RNA polymerase specialized sigma24 family protein